MKSTIVKRSIVLGGNKTSVSLEDEFWKGLQTLADREGLSVSKLVERVNAGRHNTNLSSAIRVFVYNAACDHRDADSVHLVTETPAARNGTSLAS